jgi:membrane protein implicated in regulation of membrane protease activity
MEITTEAWAWLILGGILLASETITGTFYLLFFGGSAFLTAVAAQWLFPGRLSFQLGLFGLLALVSFVYVRRRPRSGAKGFESDVAQVIVLSHEIKASEEGTIQYQGSPWKAVNMSSRDLAPGQKVRIEKTEGVRLFVHPVGE